MEENILILEGLPTDFNNISSKLELYFKNKRRSGGEIAELRKHPTDDKKALLVYQDGEGAKKVLEKTVQKVSIKGFGEVELTVKLMVKPDSLKPAKTKPPVAPRPQINKPIPFKKPTPPSRKKEMLGRRDDPKTTKAMAEKNSLEVDLLLVSSSENPNEELLSMYFEKFSTTVEMSKYGDNHWILKLNTQSDVQKVLSQRGHKFGISVEVYHDNRHPQPGCQEAANNETSEGNALIVTSKETTDSVIQMYFEHFSEDFEICKIGKTQWIITFASRSDAQTCLAREQHDLGISVEVYNEQAMQKRQDPRRIVLSGFENSCRIQYVSLYIKSCYKGVQHTWEILEDEKILVTFKSDIDIPSFLKRCSTKKFQDKEITATCVERADSILVQGKMSLVSEDALMLYFSNKKRSQGGEIKSLKWHEMGTSAVITFEDCNVVSQVLEKKHHVFGTDLSVSVFHTNLQKPLVGTAPSSLVKPPDVTIPIKEALHDYITRNEVCKKEIERELENAHIKVAFDKAIEPCLKISFNAISDSLLALRLGSSWESKAKKAAQDLLDKYSVDEFSVEPDVWVRVEKEAVRLSSLNATVRYKKNAAQVVVVGLQHDVKCCVEEVRKIVATAYEELEKERNTIERSIQLGSIEELEFIWDRVHTKVEDVDFTKDDTKLTFVLKGLRDHVTKAEHILKDVQSNIISQPLPLSQALIDFINLEQPLKTLEKIERILAQRNIFISFSNQGESIQIIGEKTNVKDAEDKIGELLKEEEIPLPLDKEIVTQSEDWDEFYEGLLSEVKSSNNVPYIKLLKGKIQVCGFSSVVADVSNKLNGYLENKKPTTEEVPLKSVKEVEFVDSCMNLSEAPALKSLHVTILANKTEASPCLKITAPSSNIKEAVTVVKNKLKPIVNDTFRYPKAGQSKVLEKNEHLLQAKAKEMGSKLYFTVQKPPDVKAATTGPKPFIGAVRADTTPPSPSLPPSSGPSTDLRVNVSGVPVFLKKGDITKETVDVIVNSTNTTLNLDTGVSAAILKAAGPAVEDECKALGTQNNDGVVLTSAGNLSCKHIAHMVGPTTAADITSSIEKVLGLCEGKTVSSLSVPAIGTGRGNIGAQESLGAILKGLENHLSNTTSSNIKAMNLVIFEQKVFDDSAAYFKKRNRGSASSVRHSLRGVLPADEVKICGVRIHVKKGDITTESVKAIVNTTNANMNLTGGVSGAIFRAAGTSVEQECKALAPLQDNSAAVTSAGNLHCDFIIHMMGPHSAADASARVQKVLESCEDKGITTVSFPAVGTGGGGLKGQEAIMAMLQGVEDHLSQCSPTVLKLIYIVIDRDNVLQDFLQGLKQWKDKKQDDDDDDDDDDDTENEEAEGDSDMEEVSASSEEEEDTSHGKNTETMIGKIKVKVFCGDITKETTQAVVSSTNTSLDLSSGVSGAILKAAGKTVVDECKSKGTQPSDGVVLTQAGNMATKHIVHMVGQTKEKDIISSMYKVLQLCEQNNIQSVSFPALGTGAGNMGAAQVAHAMIEAISNFTIDRPKAVNVVHIVIFQAKMLPDFVETLKKIKKVTPRTPTGLLGLIGKQGLKTFERLQSLMTRSTQPSVAPSTAITNVTYPVMAVEVYSTSHNDLQQVQKLLDDLLSEECLREEVTSKHLSHLSESDKKALADISQGQQVEILMEASDKLSVSGKKDDTLAAQLKIKDLLLGVQERVTQESEVQRVKETLSWEVAEGEVWKPFNPSINYAIEMAYLRKDKNVSFKDSGETYTVNLKDKMCTDSKGNTQCIKRTLHGGADTVIIQHPPTWTPMTGKEHEIVTISHTKAEYKKIEKEFLKSSIHPQNTQKYEVVKIERIQSQNQWQRYAVWKQTIDKRHHGTPQPNERHLYHGTTKEIAQKINVYGFNRSFCGRNAVVHGEGTYFAKEAWYSCSDTYSNPDAQGLKYMYRARVLTGLPCKSRHGMKEPDPLDANNPQAGLHDCAVDNLQKPFIFVVFCDAGAYPDYLITFKNA